MAVVSVELPSCLMLGELVSLARISLGHHRLQGLHIPHHKKPYLHCTFQLTVLSGAAVPHSYQISSSSLQPVPLSAPSQGGVSFAFGASLLSMLLPLHVSLPMGSYQGALPPAYPLILTLIDASCTHNKNIYATKTLYLSDLGSEHAAKDHVPAVGMMTQSKRPLLAISGLGNTCIWCARLKTQYTHLDRVVNCNYNFFGIYRSG